MAEVKTKAQLEEELKQAQSLIEALQARMSEQEAMLEKSNVDGWLVTTPNPGYNGVTLRVKFHGGRAFVPASLPDAGVTVKWLERDFGYHVERISREEYEALPAPAPQPENKMLEELNRLSGATVLGG